MVLGINDRFGPPAVPRIEVWKEDFAVNTEVDGIPFVVLCLPGGHTLGAYQRRLEDRVLTLSCLAEVFTDGETGSLWDVEGRCLEGPLAGETLPSLDFVSLEWHAWVSCHPETEIYRSGRKDSPS